MKFYAHAIFEESHIILNFNIVPNDETWDILMKCRHCRDATLNVSSGTHIALFGLHEHNSFSLFDPERPFPLRCLVELDRILKIRTREPRLLSVFSKSGPVNRFFGSFSGLLEGLLAKRPGVLGLQLSKLAKDPDSRILRTRIRSSSILKKS